MMMSEILTDTLFDSLLNGLDYKSLMPVSSSMKTDICEKEDGFDLDIDLPGYKKENINAELKDGYLTINATSSFEENEKDTEGKYLRRERFHGSTSRSFYVGDTVNEEDITAKFADGILSLHIPKKEPVIPEKKLIAIE